MRQKILILAGIAILAASCIHDDGNYDYSFPEVPEIELEESYTATLGERFTVVPGVTFSDRSKLTFEWSISDPDLMASHDYRGETLDFVFNLRAREYSALLTVTDQTTGMKYFHDFTIVGQTEFSEGVLLLTSKSGAAELSFIKPDGTVQRDIYGTMNGGEELPSGPLQLVRIYNRNMMGGLYTGYWIICSDTDAGGVLIDPDGLNKIRTLRENFSVAPDRIEASYIVPIDDSGTMTGIVNGKTYVGNFEGYYQWPSYNFFTTPIIGNYQIECLAKDKTAGFYWGYDPVARRLHAFMAPARMYFDVSNIPGPPAQWDPTNIGLDLVTLQFHAGGGYMICRDDDGLMWQLGFMTGGQMTMNTSITPFRHAELITPNTKWLLGDNGVFFFTSGTEVYRYNPLSPAVAEKLVTRAESEITMLRFGRGTEQNEIVVGCEGNLYWLNALGNVGGAGALKHRIGGFDGSPVDMYDRRDPEKYPSWNREDWRP